MCEFADFHWISLDFGLKSDERIMKIILSGSSIGIHSIQIGFDYM